MPLIGSDTIASRLYSKPSVTVVGLDAPSVATAPNAIIPMAQAKISVRIPPGVDSRAATEALAAHVRDHMPWGLTAEFTPEDPANGTVVQTQGPAYDAFRAAMIEAYGQQPTEQGAGGAVPFVANLIEQFPDLEVIGTGRRTRWRASTHPMSRSTWPNCSVRSWPRSCSWPDSPEVPHESQWLPDLELALALADAASDGASMSRYLALDLKVETKPDSSPVTEADKATESALRTMLADQRPADGLLGEEFGTESQEAPRRWILDPIDGTKNYMRGVPVWSTLIALEADGELVVGVVSAPALGRAVVGLPRRGGVHSGRDRRHPPPARQRSRRALDASFSFSDEEWWQQERGAAAGLRTLIEDTWRARGYGDFLSHMFVAEGAVDIAAEPALAPWDMAALVPIVEEAGYGSRRLMAVRR